MKLRVEKIDIHVTDDSTGTLWLVRFRSERRALIYRDGAVKGAMELLGTGPNKTTALRLIKKFVTLKPATK